MAIEIQRTAHETERCWADVDGFVGPIRPGKGPRRDPVGGFPTGPAVGAALPPIVAPDAHGRTVDVQSRSAGRPAVVVFFRSAVW
ncbi:MAG: hypothetical protein AAFN30_18980 [Actinomycetota bacterium]